MSVDWRTVMLRCCVSSLVRRGLKRCATVDCDTWWEPNQMIYVLKMMTINELRAKEGLKPIAGGDVLQNYSVFLCRKCARK